MRERAGGRASQRGLSGLVTRGVIGLELRGDVAAAAGGGGGGEAASSGRESTPPPSSQTQLDSCERECSTGEMG